MEISTSYAGIPVEAAQRADFVVSSDTFRAPSASKVEMSWSLGPSVGQFRGSGADGLPGRGLREFVVVRKYGLFSNAQMLVPSVAIIRIGFDATMAAMSLAE